MKTPLIKISVLGLMAVATISAAAAKSLPVVEILGHKFYMYEAKKGDTLFGIARDNKWNDAELQRLNPQAPSPLKKGTKIYYPVASSDSRMISPGDISYSPKTSLTHVVEKGQSVYSIAQMYSMPVATIYALNPEARNGIKIGQILSLRKTPDSIPSDEQKVSDGFHTIAEGETIKSIADDYNTSVASILSLNPGLARSGVSTGNVIKMPENGAGLVEVTKVVETPVIENFEYVTVQKKDTWETIGERAGVDADLLAKANPDMKLLKKNSVVAVPKIGSVSEEAVVVERDDRENSAEGIREIYKDIHRISDVGREADPMKVVIVAETPAARKDTEFIRGFIAGLDKLKNKDLRVQLKVIDGSRSESGIVYDLKTTAPDVVFFTGDKNLPDYLLEYAESSLTPVVNTFDVRSEDYLTNPYIIQLLTPSALFNETVAANAFKKFGERCLIFLGPEDESDQLAAELKKIWNPERIKYLPMGIVDPAGMAEKDRYLFYAYTVKKNEIEKTLEEIQSFTELFPLASVALLGRPNWVMFDDSLGEAWHKVNTFIPSRFYIDENSAEAKDFQAGYKRLFNRQPVKSIPLYAAMGYDTSTYFIPGLANASNDISMLRRSDKTVQSEFDLKRLSNWSGLINPPVYFVNFTPFDTIEKIVIE